MPIPGPSTRVVRFAVFDADLRTGELRKRGVKVKLHRQPFEILVLLLERPGELVTREELREKLWPTESFLDFDRNLNKAVSRLREALGDSAETPRFIETLARRGYRFIAPVNGTDAAEKPAAVPARTLRTVPVAEVSSRPTVIEMPRRDSAEEDSSAHEAAGGKRRTIVWGVAGLAGLAMLAVIAWALLRPAQTAPASRARFAITLPPGEHLPVSLVPSVALSPDGKYLVYSAQRADVSQLYLRPIDELEARPIPGTENGLNPIVSPDGKWVGFFTDTDSKLKKVSLSGGPAVTLCGPAFTRGASWSADGSIVFTPSLYSGLARVSGDGGTPKIATTLDSNAGDRSHRWPEVLPGGKAVLFTVQRAGAETFDDALIAVQSLVTGEQRVLVRGGTSPHYASSGHLVYARAGALMAVPFDPAKLEVNGAPVKVLDGVLEDPTTGAAHFGFSGNGSLLYVAGGVLTNRTLVWVDRKGVAQPLAAPPRAYSYPRLSPDGHRVVVQVDGAENQVWIYNLERGTLTRLTSEGENSFPFWSPDGRRVTFTSTQTQPPGLFWMPADSSGPPEKLIDSEWLRGAWSPDGRLLAFTQFDPQSKWDLWMLPAGEHRARPFLRTRFAESTPMFSPDGRWLAYQSDESGRAEIYVQPVAEPGHKWQVSTAGGIEPVWARDGRELFYRQGDKMMAVEVAGNPGFSAGKPRTLFEGVYWSWYDVAPDGRFLMVRSEQQFLTPQLHVVLDWFDELKSRVPAAKN